MLPSPWPRKGLIQGPSAAWSGGQQRSGPSDPRARRSRSSLLRDPLSLRGALHFSLQPPVNLNLCFFLSKESHVNPMLSWLYQGLDLHTQWQALLPSALIAKKGRPGLITITPRATIKIHSPNGFSGRDPRSVIPKGDTRPMIKSM